MLSFARFLVWIICATWPPIATANAQSGIYKSTLADCMAAGYDHGKCADYSSCIESQMRRDFTAAQQFDYLANPKKPSFVEWTERTKRYCIDQARLPPETPAAKVVANDPENTLFILTTAGLIKIALLPNASPKHIASLKELVRKKYYDDRSFAFNDIKIDSIVLPYDMDHKAITMSEESPSATLDLGDVAMLDDRHFFISRRYNQNRFVVVGHVADGLPVLDSLKAPDTTNPPFGYPPHLYFEPDRVLAVRIAGDANSSDIVKLENEKSDRIAIRAKKNAEHASKYGIEMGRLNQIINGVPGNWIATLKSPDGHDATSTWKITKEANPMASSKMTLYAAVSVQVTNQDDSKNSVSNRLQGTIEKEDLSVGGYYNLNLESAPARCRVIWKLHAKSPTEFEGIWKADPLEKRFLCPKTRSGSDLTGTMHLQKE